VRKGTPRKILFPRARSESFSKNIYSVDVARFLRVKNGLLKRAEKVKKKIVA
jgi:hypothetical protein